MSRKKRRKAIFELVSEAFRPLVISQLLKNSIDNYRYAYQEKNGVAPTNGLVSSFIENTKHRTSTKADDIIENFTDEMMSSYSFLDEFKGLFFFGSPIMYSLATFLLISSADIFGWSQEYLKIGVSDVAICLISLLFAVGIAVKSATD